MPLTLNSLASRKRDVKSKFLILNKEGIKEKNSYVRCDYEAVADAPQSNTI